MKTLFVDTGAWFAYLVRSDPDHARVRTALDGFRGEFITTDYVFDELVTLALVRLGHAAAIKAGSLLRDSHETRLELVLPNDQEGAWKLFQERTDKTSSFTDCTSFTVMRRLGIEEAATTDEHFEQEGFKVIL